MIRGCVCAILPSKGGHIWVFVGRKFDPGGDLRKTQEFVSYMYADTWEAKDPETFLKDCSAIIQGDAYHGYERIADPHRGDHVGRILAGCAMHAQRPFVQALEAKDPSALFFVEGFRKIYRIEAEGRSEGWTGDERLEHRKKRSLPLLHEL